MTPPYSTGLNRLQRCLHLGPRLDPHNLGCMGQCRHRCDHFDPALKAAHPEAVPAGNCQTCPDYDADSVQHWTPGPTLPPVSSPYDPSARPS